MKVKSDIYCLHIETLSGALHHYIGATRRGRFEKRLREHRRGVGSALTAKLVAEGCTMDGAVFHTNALTEEEQIYQCMLPLSQLCVICRQREGAVSSETSRHPDSSSRRAAPSLRFGASPDQSGALSALRLAPRAATASDGNPEKPQ